MSRVHNSPNEAHTCRTATWEVENGLSALVARESNPDLLELSSQAKADFERHHQQYLEKRGITEGKHGRAVTTSNAAKQ